MAQECRMGNLEETILSEAMFPEIGALEFRNEVRFICNRNKIPGTAFLGHDGLVNTLYNLYAEENMAMFVDNFLFFNSYGSWDNRYQM